MNNGKVIGLIENSNFLKFHICYKNKVVGYPIIIKNSAGSVLSCRWCLDMFLGYKNFFSQYMSDGKVVSIIEKNTF